MHEFKEGTLKSSSGQKVTNRKQAIAIGMSEDRKMGMRKGSMPKGMGMKGMLKGHGTRVEKA